MRDEAVGSYDFRILIQNDLGRLRIRPLSGANWNYACIDLFDRSVRFAWLRWRASKLSAVATGTPST